MPAAAKLPPALGAQFDIGGVYGSHRLNHFHKIALTWILAMLSRCNIPIASDAPLAAIAWATHSLIRRSTYYARHNNRVGTLCLRQSATRQHPAVVHKKAIGDGGGLRLHDLHLGAALAIGAALATGLEIRVSVLAAASLLSPSRLPVASTASTASTAATAGTG